MAYNGFLGPYNQMGPTINPYLSPTMPQMQQQQMMMQQSQEQTGPIWVQGEAGAKSYMVAPGKTVPLWDSEAQVIYMKTADQSGMPSMKILDYTIRDDLNLPAKKENVAEYATKNEVESIKDNLKHEIDVIKESLGIE